MHNFHAYETNISLFVVSKFSQFTLSYLGMHICKVGRVTLVDTQPPH